MLVNTAEDEDTIFNFLDVVAPNLTTLLDADGQASVVGNGASRFIFNLCSL